MKTIEERAREFVGKASAGQDVPDYINELLVECFCAAAMVERKLLTEWHDPKEELPEDGRLVLLKTTFGKGYQLAEHEETGWWRPYDDEWEISDDQVIGWREIHES